MFVVVSYDVPQDKRRTKIMKTLKNYGLHAQYSVFECHLNDTQYTALRRRLQKLIEPQADSVRFYFLCANDVQRIETIGVGPPVEHTADTVLVGF